MKHIGRGRRAWRLVLAGLFLALAVGCARAPPPLERYRKLEFPPTGVFKEQNLLLSRSSGPFSKEESLVFATALSDPAGYASALYGVSRKCLRWGSWVENHPTWFVIDREGTITYTAQPAFSTPTSYVDDIDLLLDALRKAK